MKIAIVTIATNIYISWVPNLLEKIDRYFLSDDENEFTCFLFTDFNQDNLEETSDNIRICSIEHKKWPEPALKKYNYINSQYENLKEFDYIYLFDADVDIISPVGEEVLQDLVGVLHPYKILEQKEEYPYEDREQSTAYVKPENYDKYYAAAFVGGKSETFLEMARTISKRVEEDEKNDIIALWHDESHLNKYFNENPPTALSPSYMYPEELLNHPGYPWTPKIVAIKKDNSINKEKISQGQYGKITKELIGN